MEYTNTLHGIYAESFNIKERGKISTHSPWNRYSISEVWVRIGLAP
jgi:hypothetical protein